MIPEQTFVNFPPFGTNTASANPQKPDDTKYANGFQAEDTLPYEWLNWFLNRSSDGVSKLNSGALSMERELINVVTAGGGTPDGSDNTQVLSAIQYLIQNAGSAVQEITGSTTITPTKNTKAFVTGNSVTVTLGSASAAFMSVELFGTKQFTMSYTNAGGTAATDTIPANAVVKYTYNGSGWVRDCAFVKDQVLYL